MENSNNKDISPNLQQGAVSGSINLSEFKEEVVSKVKELNNCLKGYKTKYKNLSVVLSQEEYKNMSNEKLLGGLLVEFIEKPTLSEVTVSSAQN